MNAFVRIFLRTCGLLLTLVIVVANASAALWETSVTPGDNDKFKSADYRIWLPHGVQQIRAVIVRQHGCGRNGITHANDLQWQALAAKWDAALLGTHYQVHEKCDEWSNPDNGSEQAFLSALATFAAQTKHPELTTAPWAFWGHSGGAYWSIAMLKKHPARVIGVWARSGGRPGFTDEAAFQVPVVFNFGNLERTDRFQKLTEDSVACLAEGRAKGALWTIAEDPKSSHDCRNSRLLAIPYFDAILALRLPPVQGADKRPKPLLPIAANTGWLGDLKSADVAPAQEFSGNSLAAGWLPNEAVARKWREYCLTGAVVDKTPPPAPTNVFTVVTARGTMHVGWQAVADLDSGLKQFIVLRDGQPIGTVGGEKTKANSQGFVQIWNYGDEPEPVRPDFMFDDPVLKTSPLYTIKAVNQAGLESAPSDAK